MGFMGSRILGVPKVPRMPKVPRVPRVPKVRSYELECLPLVIGAGKTKFPTFGFMGWGCIKFEAKFIF